MEDKKDTSKYELICEEKSVHHQMVEDVIEELPTEEDLYDLAEFFKVFGDSTRIRILYTLFESAMCVCDIAEVLNMTQSAISHQLRVLKQANLVVCRRDGKQMIYALEDEHIRSIVKQGMKHVVESSN